MAHADYEFHQLDDSRFEDVQFIFREVFNKHYSLSYLKAKYDTSWTGVKHLCFLAYANNQPAAFYGAIPQLFIYKGERFLAAHTCDSFTMPAHQRKGLHKQLALRTYEVMKAAGVKFVYAYHSENTYHSCKKLDWKEHVHIRRFFISTGMPPWGKVMRRLPLLRTLHAKLTKQLLQKLSVPATAWQPPPSNKAVMQVDYQPSFFDYKSFTPNAIVNLAGARFWIKAEAVIAVGAVQFDDEQQLEQGLRALKGLARKLGLSRILFQTAPGFPLNQWLEQHYEGYESWLVGHLNFEEDIPLADWEMRYGDLDTF